MKKNRIFSAFAAATLLLAGACTSDQLTPGGEDESKKEIDASEGVYMTVNFDLPSAKNTRSTTNGEDSSDSGTEVGQDYENNVTTAAIVLTTISNDFIAYAVAEQENGQIVPVGTEGNAYRATGKFSKTDLAANYYNLDDDRFVIDQNTGNHKLNIYVFCNPTKKLLKALNDAMDTNDPNWFNGKGEWDDLTDDEDERIWTPNNFLMSNALDEQRLFPATLDDWDTYSTESNPFNLSGLNNFGRPNEVDNLTDRGNIKVMRACARYDFRDGALDGAYIEGSPNKEDKTYNGFEAQKYHVVLDLGGDPLVDVYLGRMSIVNMNRSYYYLRRVSNNGRMTASQSDGTDNNLTICGPEMPWVYDANTGELLQRGNYVVDAEANWKYIGSSENDNKAPSTGFAAKFNYPFFDENGILDNVDESNGRWDTYMIADVLNGKSDNWNNQDGRPNTGKYKIWRYLTEGTIPGINSQKNGVSNGIVFKGQMLPAREAKNEDDYYTKLLLETLKPVKDQTAEQVASNHLIFSFGGHLYITWESIRRMAIYLSLKSLEYKDGKWTCEVDRTLRLYKAVFGEGGFGSVDFDVDEATHDPKTANFLVEAGKGNATLSDDLDVDEASPDAKFKKWGHNGYETQEYFAFRDAVVDSKITIYQESYDEALGGWAYYCYYYYWNRHNDNGKNGVMGAMEFAVVRNNVYKLAVTKIQQLGHPRIVVNDPDAPDPNTPDELSDVYITVTCETLPWVVRENNIVFP